MQFRSSLRICYLRFVEGIDAGVDGSTIRLHGGHRVPVSRRQSKKLRENMGLS